MSAKRLKTILGFLIMALVGGCSEESDRINMPNPPVDNSTVQFKNVQSVLQQPSQVQFTFRLTDRDNHALLLPEDQRSSLFRIFENGNEIDYTETSYFVHSAISLELDMVLLLDFTNSMASWQEGELNGIDLMVGWARELIDEMASVHRIAIMEYHDRNFDAGVISPFTTDKNSLNLALDDFLQSSIDHGSSRIWDALYSAVELFDGSPEDDKQRIVIFITDGRETSSFKTPEQIITRAKDWKTSIFILAAGDVTNRSQLNALTTQTDGEFYDASSIEQFRERLEQIKLDLGGQYKVSYITLRTTGTYTVKVQFSYQQYSGSFERTLDLGSIYGDDRIGVLTFDLPTAIQNRLEVLVRSQHTPRNINRFRFKVETEKTVDIALPTADDGGLCAGWLVTAPDTSGFWEISSETPIKFGDFGPLFRIIIDNVTEGTITIPFVLDNDIYTGGKSFTYPSVIVFARPD